MTLLGRGSLSCGKHLVKSSWTTSTRHSSDRFSRYTASLPTVKHTNMFGELGKTSKLFNDL